MTVQLADDVYFLRSGAVVAHQAAAELRAPSARQAAIKAYFGSAGSRGVSIPTADDRPPR